VTSLAVFSNERNGRSPGPYLLDGFPLVFIGQEYSPAGLSGLAQAGPLVSADNFRTEPRFLSSWGGVG
jgi:hypothetical protein